MLFDSRIAQEIVQKINDNSEAGQSKCPFIDSDGGLSLVARNWTKLCPSRPVTVFQRDKALSPLTEKLLEKSEDPALSKIPYRAPISFEKIPVNLSMTKSITKITIPMK